MTRKTSTTKPVQAHSSHDFEMRCSHSRRSISLKKEEEKGGREETQKEREILSLSKLAPAEKFSTPPLPSQRRPREHLDALVACPRHI